MSKVLITEAYLTDIADSIRAKYNNNNKYTVAQMSDAIDAIPTIVNESWHQCPQVVRNYIDNVDYTGIDYTQSSISSYAPATPVPSTNTKPLGKTIDGITYYNNIPGIKTPFASTNKAGTVKPLDSVRWINSTATSNFRDIGGWACDGGTIKYGLIYRSGTPGIADENLILKQLGINTEIDLTADSTPAFSGKMRFVCHPTYAMYTLTNTTAWVENLQGVFNAVIYGDPVLIHCSMGADRTGTLICVLEGLLGMSQSDIDKDYELTSFYTLRARNGNYQGGTSDWAHLMGEINALSGNTFQDKCVNFVLSLGFTIEEINAYRAAMIDGIPTSLTVPTVSITGTYTGCTTSNQTVSIEMYQSYTATITPNSGYTITDATVSIMMGGTNVTSSVYSGGVINITKVTGNIVITVSAKVDDRRVELFDSATATLNVRFNSSGVSQTQNGNFATDFIPVTLNSSEPWRIHIKEIGSDTKFQAPGSYETVCYYNVNKSIMNTNYGRLTISTSGSNTLRKYNDDAGGTYIDINKVGDGNYIPSNFFDLSQVAYIRLCITYSGGTAIASASALSNVSIKADKITN